MKQHVPKAITYLFFLQLGLLFISCVLLGLIGIGAIITLIAMVALAPVVALLGTVFPYKQWKRYGSGMIVAALVIDGSITVILLIRFVIISFILHLE